jgi:hypothetical protein
MVLIVMVLEGERLLAIRRSIGVIDIQHHGGGRLRVTGKEVIHEGPCEPLEVCTVDVVVEARAGRGARSVVFSLQGRPLHPEFAQGVTAEGIGVIGGRIPRGDLLDTLGQQVPSRMINLGWIPFVVYSGCEALRQTHLPIDTTEEESPKVGGQGAPSKSARIVCPAPGGTHRCFGLQSSISKPRVGFTEWIGHESYSIKDLHEVCVFL